MKKILIVVNELLIAKMVSFIEAVYIVRILMFMCCETSNKNIFREMYIKPLVID